MIKVMGIRNKGGGFWGTQEDNKTECYLKKKNISHLQRYLNFHLFWSVNMEFPPPPPLIPSCFSAHQRLKLDFLTENQAMNLETKR